MDSEARLRLVTDAAGLAIDGTPIPLPSDSNDAWKIGEIVLRICWRGDRTRLYREAVILEHLPEAVPHVRLADAGVTEDLTWTLTRWIPGTRLSDLWADLDTAQRHGAAAQLAHTLEALHDWETSPQIRDAIAARPPQRDTGERVGANLNQQIDVAVRAELASQAEPNRPSLTMPCSRQNARRRLSLTFARLIEDWDDSKRRHRSMSPNAISG